MSAASSDPAGGRRPPHYPIESVDNALRLLLLFAEKPRIRLTEASVYLGVASSTAHRLLAMLQYRGFVRQDAVSRAYEPGGALTTIASAMTRQVDVRARARPVLERLSAEFDETVHLGRLDGALAHLLDAIESTRAVRVGSRAGRALPAHGTSTGKAMLSRLTRDELVRLYPERELAADADEAVTSRDDLERELDTVRRRGYATSTQQSAEGAEGVASIAASATSPAGVLYAVTVSLPTSRMTAATRARVAKAVRAAAVELADLIV